MYKIIKKKGYNVKVRFLAKKVSSREFVGIQHRPRIKPGLRIVVMILSTIANMFPTLS